MTPESASLILGVTMSFNAVLACGDDLLTPIYRSSDTAVATIRADGLVTGRREGTTVISAIAANDTTIRVAALLTVVVHVRCPLAIAMTPVTASIAVGATQQFTAVFGCSELPPPQTFRSSDTTVATISPSGLALGLRPGTAVITALQQSDTTKRAQAVLTVR